MSRSIDQRIVDMQFNNKQFETGISDSLGSIDKLKSGLGNLDNAGLNGLISGIDTIASRFSTFGIMGVEVLQRVANAAIDAGTQLVKSLAIEPITEGLAEYELKMGSIQTIMAGSGADLETVNKHLNELNNYADKTIYSFSDMTQNIGKFTNAGVDIEKSVGAIQGIANVAAVSGANTNEASRAMYNFAQALSAGYVKLIDWKSIELANMGTVEFKTQLLDAAVAAGTLTKNTKGMYQLISKETGEVLPTAISATTGFNDSLKDQWLTSEVLVKTLNDYADETTNIGKKAFAAAQDVKTFSQLMDTMKEAVGSGWAQTFEILIGDFEEAKALWTGINNVVGTWVDQASDARNNLLKGWDDLGGRTALLEGFKNAFSAILAVIKPIKEALEEVFPPMTAERLFNLTRGFQEFTEKLIISDETSDKLKRTFAGLFSMLGFVADAFSFLFSVLGKVLGFLSPVGAGFLDVTASIGDFIVKLRQTGSIAEGFQKALEVIGNILDWIDEKIKMAVGKIADYFGQFSGIDLGPLKVFSGDVEAAFSPFTFIAGIFTKAFEAIARVWEWAAPIIVPKAKAIGDAVRGFSKSFGEALRSGDLQKLASLFTTGAIGVMILKIGDFIKSLTSFGDKAGGLLDGIKGILDGVRGSLEAWQKNIQAKTLKTIATAVLLLAAGLWVLSTIPSEKLAPSIAAITVLFAELAAMMAFMAKGLKGVKMTKVAGQMILMSGAILILATALKKIASIDSDTLFSSVTAIGLLMAMLTATAKSLSSDSKKVMSGSAGLVAMAGAILILSSAVEKLSKLTWEELAKGLIAVGALLAELVLFTKLVGDGKGIMKVGTAMVPLATGILILSVAVKSLADLSWEELAKGLIGLSGALLSISVMSKIVSPGEMLAMGLAMTPLATGILVLSVAIKSLGGLSWEELGKGLIGLGGALLSIALMSKIVSPGTLLAMGVAMLGVSVAINLIALAMSHFGSMSLEEIGKSLIMLGGSLAILSIAMNVMKGAMGGAAAMLIMAAALAIMTPSLVIFGSMDIQNIGLALLMIAGVFAIFGIAAFALGPVVPIMIGLAAALTLLGVGLVALGAGLVLVATGLGAFAVGGTAFILALEAIILSLISLIPAAAVALAEGIIAIIDVLTKSMDSIVALIKEIILGICEVVIETGPEIIKAVFVLLTELLEGLRTYIPLMIEVGFELLLAFLHGIADNIEEIITTALEIITNFLTGIAQGLPDVAHAAVDVVIAFVRALGLELPRLVDAGFKMIIDLMTGLAQAINDNADELGYAAADLGIAIIKGIIKGLGGFGKRIWEEIQNVGKAIWNGFKDFFGIHSPSTLMEGESGNVVLGIIKGLAGGVLSLANKAKEIGGAIFDGIKGGVSKIGEIASNVVGTLGDGLKSGLKTVGDAAKNVGSSILGGIKGILGINSPASTMIDAAGDVGDGWIVGFKKIMTPVTNAAKSVGTVVLDTMRDSISRIGDAFDSDISMSPTITPVIDMSNVEKGLTNTFGKTQNLNVGEIKGTAASIATSQNGSSLMLNGGNASSEGRVAAAIESLEQNMNTLVNKIAKLQVVMDSGALVGEIAPAMDDELGSLAHMTRRRVR